MRAAVIGCGRMGAFTSETMRRYAPACWFPLSHAEAISSHPDLTLSALCDSNGENLARASAAYGVVATYAEYGALAAEVRPELVGIATRTIGRAEIIECFAQAGTTAFHIEKPLCTSVAELDRMERLLGQPGIFATYGTIRRFFDIYVSARDLIESGRLGALIEIRVSLGPGALYWTQPHAVDLILFFAGERSVEGVQACLSPIVAGDRPADIANDPIVNSSTIWFGDGVAGHIGRGPGYDVVLSCEDGEVTVASDGHYLTISERSAGKPYLARAEEVPLSKSGAPQGVLSPVSQLVECLKGDAAAIADNRRIKRDILMGQRLAFAMVSSHQANARIVDPLDIDPDMRILARTGASYA